MLVTDIELELYEEPPLDDTEADDEDDDEDTEEVV
jgi:hypothetical protein